MLGQKLFKFLIVCVFVFVVFKMLDERWKNEVYILSEKNILTALYFRYDVHKIALEFFGDSEEEAYDKVDELYLWDLEVREKELNRRLRLREKFRAQSVL
jgi:hypothetical protein